jgi:prefoldin beta subunit
MTDKFQDKLGQLQLVQQNMENFGMQRQQFQLQQSEIDAALVEVRNSPQSYKMIGNIMVLVKKEDLIKDLEEKREMLGIRISTIEKQEEKLRVKFEELQQEMITEYDKKTSNTQKSKQVKDEKN